MAGKGGMLRRGANFLRGSHGFDTGLVFGQYAVGVPASGP